MVDVYLLAGAIGLLIFAADRLRWLGWFFGLMDQRTTQAAFATGAAAAKIRRFVTRSEPTVWELTPGCRIVLTEGGPRFGRRSPPGGEWAVTGARWVRQRVEGKSTADWREFSLDQNGHAGLLVVLKFMNKIVLMRRLRPDEFAEGCATVDDVERFILQNNRAGTPLQGGPEREAMRVGRVGPVRYSDVSWPEGTGRTAPGAESFLAGSEDKSRQLLARKEAGTLCLWYGQTVDPAGIRVCSAGSS